VGEKTVAPDESGDELLLLEHADNGIDSDGSVWHSGEKGLRHGAKREFLRGWDGMLFGLIPYRIERFCTKIEPIAFPVFRGDYRKRSGYLYFAV